MQLSINQDLDLSKYRRFFAFGCSFTEYKWATWADVLGKQFGDNYYNYGKSGGGNSFILYSLIEANKRHKFTRDDLVIVQWSGVYREDRYINNCWRTVGNVYHPNDFYDEKFIEKYVCERGYLIQTVCNINAATLLLNSTDCNWDFLSMMPIADFDEAQYSSGKGLVKYSDSDFNNIDVARLFLDDLRLLKPSFFITLFDGFYRNRYSELVDDPIWLTGKDIHPTPLLHLEFLEKTYNIDISQETKDYVNTHNHVIMSNPSNRDWNKFIPEFRHPVYRF